MESRLSALNSHFVGNMAANVKKVDVGGQEYQEVIEF